MMEVIDSGLNRLLNLLRLNWGDLTYHLLKEAVSITPEDTGDVYSSRECDFEGYAPKVAANWTVAAGVSGFAGITADYLLWQRTGGEEQDVYGYYVTAEDGTVLWAESYDGAPIPAPLVPMAISLQPFLGLSPLLDAGSNLQRRTP